MLDERRNGFISFNVIRIIFGRRGAVMSGFLWTDILNCVLNDLTEDGGWGTCGTVCVMWNWLRLTTKSQVAAYKLSGARVHSYLPPPQTHTHTHTHTHAHTHTHTTTVTVKTLRSGALPTTLCWRPVSMTRTPSILISKRKDTKFRKLTHQIIHLRIS
jgi:hypothetical protein